MKGFCSVIFIFISIHCFANDSLFNVVKELHSKADFIIFTKNDFVKAIENSKEGDILYLKKEVEIDLTGYKGISLKKGIKLIGDREEGKCLGALLYTNDSGVFPLFEVKGEDVLIAGVRIKGEDGDIFCSKDEFLNKSEEEIKKKYLEYYYKNMNCTPVSCGISTRQKNTVIFNCELYQWTHTSIYVQKGAINTKVLNCDIHHNQRFGLGYGVTVDSGSAVIWYNKFQYNRHSIASTGRLGSSYDIRYNTFLEEGNNSWAIDMHGGVDRKDGTNIAGEYGLIEYNTFYLNYKGQAVVFRGKPMKESSVRFNKVYIGKESVINESKIFEQKYAKGNFRVLENQVLNENYLEYHKK